MRSSTQTLDVLILGSVWYHGHQLTDQRVAHAIGEAGRSVVYVDPARNVLVPPRDQSQGRNQRFGCSIAEDGMEIFTAGIIPKGRTPLLVGFSNLLIVLQLWAILRRRLTTDTAVLAFAAHPTLLWLLRRHRRVIVVKDNYVAGSGLVKISAAQLQRRRRTQLNRCEAVITVSEVLRGELLKEGVAARVIPSGAKVYPIVEAEAEALHHVQSPRAIFSGLISDRIDFSLLESIADLGWQLVLVGGVQPTFSDPTRFRTLCDRENVHFLGWREPAELDRIAQSCDVGLIPYTLSDFNLASSPLKTLEYLAAGLPVMSSRLPAVMALQCDDVLMVDSPADVSISLRACVQMPPKSRERRRQFAERRSWNARAEQYLMMLDQ